MNTLERLYYDPPSGMFREFEGLNTHFEPRDLDLYRRLLPEQFAMPQRPLVKVFVVDYLRVVRWPYNHYHYQEWSALLRCTWKGGEGWYCLTIPVTKMVAKIAGRYLGFPKYITDEISLSKKGEIRTAAAYYKNIEHVALEFCPGLTRQLTAWENALLEKESFFGDETVFLLVPPGRGPRAQKLVLRHAVPAKWSPQVGMVHLRVDPSESWAGLVPEAAEFPGTYNYFTGGMNLIVEG